MKLKIIKIDKKEWVSFILTLIATLVGVLIAISLTNSGIRSKERQDTIKLLRSANMMATSTSDYSSYLNELIVELSKDTVNYDQESINSIKSLNPIPYPDLLETILSNELISKNVSGFSHNFLFDGLINLRKLAKYESVDYYQKYLEQMELILTFEIEYQKGEINSKELESKSEKGLKKIEDKYSNEVKKE